MDSTRESIVLVKTEVGLYTVDSEECKSSNGSQKLKWQKLLENDDPLYEIINSKINEKPEKEKFQLNLSPRSEINCIRDNDRNKRIEENVAVRNHLQPEGVTECLKESPNAKVNELSPEKVQNCSKRCMDRLLDTEAVVVMYCNNDDLHRMFQRIGITDIDVKINDMKNKDKYFIFGVKDKEILGIQSRRKLDTPRPKCVFKALDVATHLPEKSNFNFTHAFENDFVLCVGKKDASSRYSKGDTKSASNVNDRCTDLNVDKIIHNILDYVKSLKIVSNKNENKFYSKEKFPLEVSQFSPKQNSPNYSEFHRETQKANKKELSRIPRHVSRDTVRNEQIQNNPLANTVDELATKGNSTLSYKLKTDLNDDFNLAQNPGIGDMVEFGSNTCIYGRRKTEEYVPSFFCKGKDRRRRKNTITFEEYKKTKATKENDFVQNADNKISEHVSLALKSEAEMINILPESDRGDEMGYIPSFLNKPNQFGNSCYGRPKEKGKLKKEQISKCEVKTSKSSIETKDVGILSGRSGRTNNKYSLNRGSKFDDLAPLTSLSSAMLTNNEANYKQDDHQSKQQKSGFSKSLHEEVKEWRKSASESFSDYIINNNKNSYKKTYGEAVISTNEDEENTPSAQYQTACEDLDIQYWNNCIQVTVPSENGGNKTKTQPQEKGEKASEKNSSKCGEDIFAENCGSFKEQPEKRISSPIQGEKESPLFKFYPSTKLPTSLERIHVPLLSSNQFENVTDDGDIDIMIGSGAYGSCYLATSKLNGREVIIKEFQSGINNDDIIQEARVLLHLHDTGYVPECIGIMYPGTITSFDSMLVLVQEYYGHGVTLKDLCQKMPKCKEPTNRGWLGIVHQLVKGLNAIHKKHVLLNDIKTDNILVDITSRNYPIRYIDMGNATYKKGYVYPCSKEYLKAYYYLAPEVRMRQPSTPASDIFSLGYLIHGINAKVKLSGLEYVYLKCTENNPEDRPRLEEIERMVLVH